MVSVFFIKLASSKREKKSISSKETLTALLFVGKMKLCFYWSIFLFCFREERILFIMEFIAPAVMNGGFSTIVALSLLGTRFLHNIFIFILKIYYLMYLHNFIHEYLYFQWLPSQESSWLFSRLVSIVIFFQIKDDFLLSSLFYSESMETFS